eukprot:Pgem_evm1s17429
MGGYSTGQQVVVEEEELICPGDPNLCFRYTKQHVQNISIIPPKNCPRRRNTFNNASVHARKQGSHKRNEEARLKHQRTN